MNQWIVEALVDLWPELPALFRPDWRDIFPHLERVLTGLRVSSTAAERAAHLRSLAERVSAYPSVLARMNEARERRRIQRSEHPGLPPPSHSELAKGIDSCLDPPLVRRQVEIRAPYRLSTKRIDILEVALLTGPDDPGAALALRAGQPVRVHVQGTPGTIETLSEAEQEMDVQLGRNSARLRFQIQGLKPGEGRLLVDFFQFGVPLRRFVLLVEIQAVEEVDLKYSTSQIELATGGRYRLPADLDLRINLWQLDGRPRLTYHLNSYSEAVDVTEAEMDGAAFEIPGESYQRYLMERVERVRRGEVALDQVGRELYEQLFPESMRLMYWRFRKKAKTLQIISDEPWIPWELVKPYGKGPSEEAFEDPFLGQQFQCTRWRSGPGKAGTIQISRLACIGVESVPGRKLVAYPSRDRRFLAELAQEVGLEDQSPVQAVVGEVRRVLARSDIDLFHVAAPGEIRLEEPAEAWIILADGGSFSDRDLPSSSLPVGQRPLVFFNVPYAAQQGRGLTRLEGWVRAWVTGGRCGAFIAPLWTVSDSLAHLFAKTFYQGLKDKRMTISEAFAQARDRVREEAPEDPAWISYCLYANPNAEVVFVGSTGAT